VNNYLVAVNGLNQQSFYVRMIGDIEVANIELTTKKELGLQFVSVQSATTIVQKLNNNQTIQSWLSNHAIGVFEIVRVNLKVDVGTHILI